MIDIALKHFIYEVCLDVMFDKISHNFRTFNKDIQIVVGGKYRVIMIDNMFGDSHELMDASVEYDDEDTFLVTFWRLGTNGGPPIAQDDGTPAVWHIHRDYILGVWE